MSARGITVVGASAGSGKTYRLTEEVIAAIDPKAEAPIALEGLVAVTFTRKAHAELAARIRRKLVTGGSFADAMRLPLAYLGTVHAACLRLLQEFALDAGLSPNLEVVGQDPARLLRQAFDRALPVALRTKLEKLARKVELRFDPQTDRVDWIRPVFEIMELARANRIPPEALPAMAERSAAGFLALFPPPRTDISFEDAIAAELPRTIQLLEKKNDNTEATKKVLEQLKKAAQRLQDDELPWSDWTKLATATPSRACASTVTRLKELAADYLCHPRLHEDVPTLTFAIFEAAQIGLTAYQAWKAERRVVDYVDMLDRALSLLDNARVRRELERRLELVVVDEFQDTSPIQLALFVELHALAKRSVWVGDRKQCIFEYAGADPLLMDRVTDWVVAAGGTRDRLELNRRSRPELVAVCNTLFTEALARHGFTRDEVEVTAQRPSPAELAPLPPLGFFSIEAKNEAGEAAAIAEGVRRLLAKPEDTPVVDRITGAVRPVRPADIAILVAKNAFAAQIAGALHARGIRAALARAGLLDTPEGTLVDSALRWLIDARDSLAAATLDSLLAYGGQEAETWLAERLRAIGEGAYDTTSPAPWRDALEKLRPALALLSPSEAVDQTLAALDAVHLCARWPDAPQRIANLDALRALATAYEQRCAQQREAATVAGLLRHFDDMRTPTIQGTEKLASDDQHVPTDDGAVVVATYHKAKGLEWPVVIMASLDRGERNDAFDVTPESEGDGFDPTRPLEGRWIRYWPWPFGRTEKSPLRDKAEQSPEGRRVAEREEKERARLLYVGFTRARDHLILAARVNKRAAKAKWLASLVDAQGAPLVGLPAEATDGDATTRIVRTSVATRVFCLRGDVETVERLVAEPRWFARRGEAAVVRAPYWIKPSSGELAWPELEAAVATASIGAVDRLPNALVIDATGYDYDVLGNAVHAFLAADVEGLSAQARYERARRLLFGADMLAHVRPESLLQAGDALRAWVESKWPGAVWRREVPVEAAVGDRRVSGIIDLLLETSEGWVIIDHKTFPATSEAAWRAKCREFITQLAAYRHALSPARVVGTWVHLPVGGGAVEILVQGRPS